VTLCSWEFLVGGQERRFSCHAGAKVATKREHARVLVSTYL
jgi:hypothetical protein